MKHLRLSLLALATIFISSGLRGQDTDKFEPFFIIQVTDPQFGMNDGENDFAYETARLEKAVAAINRLRPDFVVFTGDLVNTKGNRSQVAEFKRITSLIDSKIKLLYLPGNHDIGAEPQQSDIDAFIADYGHDRWAFSQKGSTFIGINSQLLKSENAAAEETQFSWLSTELAKSAGSNQVLVFSHYPFFIKLPWEPETYSNIGLQKRKKYFSLFSENGVDAVFAGHLHNNSEAKQDDIEMITTSAVGKPLGNAPSGIRVIKIMPGKTESVYYGLDEIPEIITFAAENK
ncbi:MAG: metallophosphoesterase [Bacteroidales bacterium]|jgi:3',5'-cyclic AMP phosphodiesterase CpdA|nr:metallophosphoesterase [Bacteroidales bacterium]